MDRRKVVKILLQLAEGMNPITGELYADDSPYHDPTVVRALFQAARQLERSLVSAQIPEKIGGPLEAPPHDEVGRAICEELRTWRTSKAKTSGHPAYTILSDKALVHISMLKPTTAGELIHAHGVGPSKIQQFGEEILGIVQRHLAPTGSEAVNSVRLIGANLEDGWSVPTPARQQQNREQGLPTRAYATWSAEEDEELRRLHAASYTTRQLAKYFSRKHGAIESRLSKLGLK